MESVPETNGSRPTAGQTETVQPINESDRAAILADRERRREHRRPAIVKAVLTILDGPTAGNTHEVLTRDLSHNGVSFLLKDGLAVGSTLKVVMQNGKTTSYVAEVIRSRPLSNGKHEMAVAFRKP